MMRPVLHETVRTTGFWRLLPKAELHCHLDGAMRLATVIEEYQRLNLPLPYATNEQAKLREYFLMEHPVKSLNQFLERFDRQTVILRDEQAIKRIAREAVVDKATDGVRLLELRYAPLYIQQASQSKLQEREIHDAVMKGILEGAAECKALNLQPIEVGIILIAVGALGQESCEKTANLAVEVKDQIVGFDIAGPEVFQPFYKPILQKIHSNGIPVTIHAGEVPGPTGATNVLHALVDLGAARIGHGIQILDTAPPEVSTKVWREQIHLEVSPYSNIITGSVSALEKHPVRRLLQDGFNISINTDDPGMMGTNLSIEYALLHEHLGLGVRDFFRCSRNAINASFLPAATRCKVLREFFSAAHEEEFVKRALATLGNATDQELCRNGEAGRSSAMHPLIITQTVTHAASPPLSPTEEDNDNVSAPHPATTNCPSHP